jgi:hypothetical protein
MPADLPQPEWNQSSSLSSAFDKILAAHDEDSTEVAYTTLLYAIGNNHAGTYYPIVLAIIPFAQQVLSESGTWPCRAILDVLVDLVESFQPEPAHATFDERPLRDLLKERLRELVPLLNGLRRRQETSLPQVSQLLQKF